MKVLDISESSFLRITIDKTKKCVFQCYVCLTCPCIVISLAKFVDRISF